MRKTASNYSPSLEEKVHSVLLALLLLLACLAGVYFGVNYQH